MQPDAREYLGQAEELDRVISVTTSGSGRWRTEEFDIDTLTFASRKAKVGPLPDIITHRLQVILRKECSEGYTKGPCHLSLARLSEGAEGV